MTGSHPRLRKLLPLRRRSNHLSNQPPIASGTPGSPQGQPDLFRTLPFACHARSSAALPGRFAHPHLRDTGTSGYPAKWNVKKLKVAHACRPARKIT